MMACLLKWHFVSFELNGGPLSLMIFRGKPYWPNITWNTSARFFADVLAVTAANGNLDRWSVIANAYFPLGSGPRKSIYLTCPKLHPVRGWLNFRWCCTPTHWLTSYTIIYFALNCCIHADKEHFALHQSFCFFVHLDVRHEQVIQRHDEK